MNLILLLFAIPFATIVFSVVLQRIIKSPILVALTIFSVFLLLAFTVFDDSFLIPAILYTILSYITAITTRFVKRLVNRFLANTDNSDNDGCGCNQDENNTNDTDDNGCGCGCNRSALIINENSRRRYWR